MLHISCEDSKLYYIGDIKKKLYVASAVRTSATVCLFSLQVLQ